MFDPYSGKGSAVARRQEPPTNTLHTFGYDAEGKIVLRAARTSFDPSRDHFTGEAALMLREAVVVRKQTNIDPFVLWDHIMGSKWVTPPIDMILYCPNCGEQHIDAPEYGNPPAGSTFEGSGIPDWSNPPHRSHLCHGCGTIWRPADVPTNGVVDIKTEGKSDTWVVYHGEIDAVPAAKEHTPMSAHPAIRIEFRPADEIEHACTEAVRIADQLQCDAVFNFNGVHVHARPGVDPMALANAWDRELRSGSKVKVAMV